MPMPQARIRHLGGAVALASIVEPAYRRWGPATSH